MQSAQLITHSCGGEESDGLINLIQDVNTDHRFLFSTTITVTLKAPGVMCNEGKISYYILFVSTY